MAFEVLGRDDPRFPKGKDLGPDRLTQQQMAHSRKVDEKEVFTSETVTISTGPKNVAQDVVLRFPRSARIVETRDDLDNVIHRERVWTGGKFVFAVYADNEPWHKAARDEWESAGRNAIDKFCAMRNLNIIHGPRAEDTNRYNIMAETREEITEIK
jgi:hypothetical protein